MKKTFFQMPLFLAQKCIKDFLNFTDINLTEKQRENKNATENVVNKTVKEFFNLWVKFK